MLCAVDWQIATYISKRCNASIFKVQQSTLLEMVDTEDEDNSLLPNVSCYLIFKRA